MSVRVSATVRVSLVLLFCITVSVRVSVTVRVSLVLFVSSNTFDALSVAICRHCVYKILVAFAQRCVYNKSVGLPDTSAPRHFGTKTVRHQYRMVPKCLETIRHQIFYWCRTVRTLPHQCRNTSRHFGTIRQRYIWATVSSE